MPQLASRRVPLRGIAVACQVACGVAAAQCVNVWRSGDTPDTSGPVYASAWWDPDGAGPASSVLVVTGMFSIAGDRLVNGIATWDPPLGTWSALGGGSNDRVRARGRCERRPDRGQPARAPG